MLLGAVVFGPFIEDEGGPGPQTDSQTTTTTSATTTTTETTTTTLPDDERMIAYVDEYGGSIVVYQGFIEDDSCSQLKAGLDMHIANYSEAPQDSDEARAYLGYITLARERLAEEGC